MSPHPYKWPNLNHCLPFGTQTNLWRIQNKKCFPNKAVMAKDDIHNILDDLNYFLFSKSNFDNFHVATGNCLSKTRWEKSHSLQNHLKSGSEFAIWVMNLAQATCLVSYQIYNFPTWADKKWKHRTITGCKKEASGGKGSRPNVSKILRIGQCLY